jgi:putative ubiquitin-RnfH superfamily antitoxin RatB of RatAB toxin-antitoxin module
LPDNPPEHCPLAEFDLPSMISKETQNQIFDIRSEVNLIKHDVSIFNKYFEKIDVTINKLGEITEQMHRLVSLHDDRIEIYRQDTNQIKILMEERRAETFHALNELEKKFDDQGTKITTALSALKIEIIEKINSDQIVANNKIHKLDVWKSLIIGGAIVAGFLINEVIGNTIHKVINPQQTTVQIQPLYPQTK